MKFHLTEIKPIHGNWITQFYNHMSTEDGSKVDLKRSGIVDVVTNGSVALPSTDPFKNIAPLPPSTSDVCESETTYPTDVTEDFVNLHLADDDSDSDCEYKDDNFNRNAFNFIFDDYEE